MKANRFNFRAWDGHKMHPIGDLTTLVTKMASVVPGLTWMQSTGLVDKNGVEIYEGDIVRWKVTKAMAPVFNTCVTVSQVVWHRGAWEFHGVGEDEGWKTIIVGDMDRTRLAVVIGNIHENQELLDA